MKKVLLSLLLTVSIPALAITPEERGLQIAVEAEKRDTGWHDQSSEMLMVLQNRQGQTSERKMHNRSLEVKGDGDKTIIIFEHPRDIKGTAFLTYSHATEPDDQWLYLPSIKRIKRISSNNKSGPFMGSEFAYEDMSSQEVDKYKYKYLGDEKVDGRDVFVVERFPQYKHSGYTRQIGYVDQKMYQPLKVVFYDRKGSLLKTLFFLDYHQHLGQYWRANKMRMVNHQNGKTTELIWKKIKFKTGLKESDFNKSSLKRAR